MHVPATRVIKAPLIEVFSSLQGEGVLIGARQIFVRFAECNLACTYCDTPFQPASTCRLETIPGSADFTGRENPIDLRDITRLISEWQHNYNNLHHSVVLTGGEPLLHAGVLKDWLPEIKPLLPIFLETNGTLPLELDAVLPLVDMISMDIKGSSTSGMTTPWTVHGQFMKLAKQRLCQVKLVVDSTTTDEELLQAAMLVSQYAPETPLVLQPRTLAAGPALGGSVLLRLQQIAATKHHDVRIIPQIHPFLGVA